MSVLSSICIAAGSHWTAAAVARTSNDLRYRYSRRRRAVRRNSVLWEAPKIVTASDGAADKTSQHAPAQACVVAERMPPAPPNVPSAGVVSITVPTRCTSLARSPPAARCHSLCRLLSRPACSPVQQRCVSWALRSRRLTGQAVQVQVPALSPCGCATWGSAAQRRCQRRHTGRWKQQSSCVGRCAPEGCEAGDQGERDEDDLSQEVGAFHVERQREGMRSHNGAGDGLNGCHIIDRHGGSDAVMHDIDAAM